MYISFFLQVNVKETMKCDAYVMNLSAQSVIENSVLNSMRVSKDK
jgi:hypothetical protein